VFGLHRPLWREYGIMVESKSITAFAIIAVCVLVGVFFATIKKNDRLSVREIAMIGFFRSLTLWSAIMAYFISLASFIAALAVRFAVISQDDVFAMLGQPIAAHLQAWGLLYMSMSSFIAASAAMIVYMIVAIEIHLRRIAAQSERSGYFNN